MASQWGLAKYCLFQEYNAKLSDFGLAKAGPQGDKTHVSTRVVGTYGYAAPEYVMTGIYMSWSPVHQLYNTIGAQLSLFSKTLILFSETN